MWDLLDKTHEPSITQSVSPAAITTIYPFPVSRKYNMVYSKTCVRQPPLKLTLVVDVERWLSYKGTCHVILLAKLHDMYLYKTHNYRQVNG